MIFVFLAALLFGLVHPGSKWILDQGIGLLPFCILYVLIRFLAQVPFVWRGGHHKLRGMKPLLLLVAIGGVGAVLQLCEFVGIKKGLAVPLVAFLVYSHPLWSLAFSRILNGEKLKASSFLQVVFGLAGIACVAGPWILSKPSSFILILPPLTAAVFIALWVSLASKAKSLQVSALTVSFYFDLFALLTLLGLGASPILPMSAPAQIVTWMGQDGHWLMMIVYSIFAGLLPNLLFYRGSARTSARAAGLILLAEPLIATLTSHWLWRDPLSPLFVFGMICVLCAALPSEYWCYVKFKIFNYWLGNGNAATNSEKVPDSV